MVAEPQETAGQIGDENSQEHFCYDNMDSFGQGPQH
jgi:hypothetical protein